MAQPTLVVHGHFYQPPRENPWTETIAVEPSAAPHHDWNERITAESYRPNGWARIVDDRERVVAIVDNYAHLSFDVGPTLAAWLAAHEPAVLERMVEGDRAGGGAIAQAYNHVILPLASERDVRTQVRWGLADFAHRFGRRAEGMWLPETAVNDDVLRVLAEEGVRFTILAPGQARAVRALDAGGAEAASLSRSAEPGAERRLDTSGHGGGGDDWADVTDGSIDTGQAYRWIDPLEPSRGVDLVFYDGGLSHDLAFGLGSVTAEGLVGKAAQRGGLTCLATDGETFGHHHHFGERVLAYALPVAAPRERVRTGGLGAFLEGCPPRAQVRVGESSWSCAHGVERWRSDCGCSTGGSPRADQAWRAPLREALDLLRDHGVEVFERRGGQVLRDPWAARDAYVDVLLGDRELASFVEEHVVGDPVDALTLLEQQRHALLMYTSCAWFFWDLAGLETVQCLRYAARAIDLLSELGEEPGRESFLEVLRRARSNQPGEGDGGDVWRRHVEPARVAPDRVVAHLALAALLRDTPPAGPIACWQVLDVDHRRVSRGGLVVCAGRLELVHRRTGRRTRHAYAAVQLGTLEVVGAVRDAGPDGADARDVADVIDAVERGDRLSAVLRLVTDRFGTAEFGLEQSLPDAADQIVADVATALEARFEADYDRLYQSAERELAALSTAGHRLSASLRLPAERALGRRLEAEILAQGGSADPAGYDTALGLLDEAHRHGLEIDLPRAARALGRSFTAAVERAIAGDAEGLDAARALLGMADALGLQVELGHAQEIVYEALTRPDPPVPPGPGLRRLGEAVGLAPGPLGIPTSA